MNHNPDIKLSILIPSVPGRMNFLLPRLLDKLHEQTRDRLDVEIIVLYDNKKTSLGKKRNNLVSLAQGKFITFIDDDDLIADTYINDILNIIENNVDLDCVVFDSQYFENDAYFWQCKYGVELEYTHTDAGWTGKPAHTMVWSHEIMKSSLFPDKNYGEDYDWVAIAWPKVIKQIRIDKVLYFYYFSTAHLEFRHLR